MLLWSTHSRKFIFILFEESSFSFRYLFNNKLHHFSFIQISDHFSRIWDFEVDRFLKKLFTLQLELNNVVIARIYCLFVILWKTYEKIIRHCIKPLISKLNIFYAHTHYWGKELFHLDKNKIFARLTHADRNKEFMHFTIVHKFLVFSSFSPELFFFVGSNQTSTLKFKRHNLYKSDFNDQNSLSYASIVLDNWKVLLSKWVVTNYILWTLFIHYILQIS